MFVELVDSLRCPRAHDDTWLVASTDRVEERDIIQGTLGCPICHAEYPIRGGVVWFDAAPAAAPPPIEPPTADQAMRLAAFLDLSDPRGHALLCGTWGALAPLLREIAPTHIVALNPPESIPGGAGVSVIRISATIPLADATCRGIALDAAHAATRYLESAARIIRPNGRLAAPVRTPVPASFNEIARDAEIWISERSAPPSGVVPLRRALTR